MGDYTLASELFSKQLTEIESLRAQVEHEMTRANAALSEVAALTAEAEQGRACAICGACDDPLKCALEKVAALTEDKARTDAAVNDHLAHLARVTEERDLWKEAHRSVCERYVWLPNDNAAEVTRLRAALDEADQDIVWMSGSPSFAPDGQAHFGWKKVRERLHSRLREKPDGGWLSKRMQDPDFIKAYAKESDKEAGCGWSEFFPSSLAPEGKAKPQWCNSDCLTDCDVPCGKAKP